MQQGLTSKQQYWTEQLQKADAFNGSVADYAKSQGLKVQDFYRWRHFFNQQCITEQTTNTIFTQVVSTTTASAPSVTLSSGDMQLHFGRLPDPRWLAQFLALSRSL